MNRLYLIIFILISIHLSAQDSGIQLLGKITSDSLAIENVHIINKSSKTGTISDSNGEFAIKVQLNDTLIFSDIQYYLLEIKITKQVINDKKIEISLMQRINTLSEVVLKTHDLMGNLTLDSRNFKDTLQKSNPLALEYNGNYKALSNIVAKKLDPEYLPDVTDPLAPIGGDLIGLTLFLFKPLIKEVSKIGKSKRAQKMKERTYQKQAVESPDKIRAEIGDSFFIHTLHISVEKIDEFIDYCKPKGIINLFLANKKMEMIDVFFTESKTFKNN